MVNKKILVLIVVLVVVAALAAVVSKMNKPKNQKSGPEQKQKQTETPLKVERKEVPVTQAPDSFPTDIPVEKGAKIVQNYNATAENGLFQATRMFESQKSLEDNFKLYSDWLAKSGWKLVASLNQDKLKALSAQKDKANLQITMNENTQTKVRTVDISYSEMK